MRGTCDSQPVRRVLLYPGDPGRPRTVSGNPSSGVFASVVPVQPENCCKLVDQFSGALAEWGVGAQTQHTRLVWRGRLALVDLSS